MNNQINNKNNGKSSHNSSNPEAETPQAMVSGGNQLPVSGESTKAEQPTGINKGETAPKKLSGAGRKRLSYLLKKGLSRAEAYAKALQPLESSERVVPKRQRSLDQTPPEATSKKRKRNEQPSTSNADTTAIPSKRQTTASYKEMVSGVKMAVLPRDYPNTALTTEQMNTIKQLLLKKILSEEDKVVKPAFLGLSYKVGYMAIHCKDIATSEWLKRAVLNASPWEGAALCATEESKMPHSQIAIGIFPDSLSRDNQGILNYIKRQNEGLHVDIWRTLRRIERGSKITMVLAIDQKSAASLKESKGKINYCFGQVILRLKAASVNADELAEKLETVVLEEEDDSTPPNPENKEA